jgi:hypothetical protein
MNMQINNKSSAPMSDFAIQFNVNTYGLLPGLFQVPVIPAGGSHTVSIPLQRGGKVQEMDPPNMLQVAIKNNVGVYYFATLISDELI